MGSSAYNRTAKLMQASAYFILTQFFPPPPLHFQFSADSHTAPIILAKHTPIKAQVEKKKK